MCKCTRDESNMPATCAKVSSALTPRSVIIARSPPSPTSDTTTPVAPSVVARCATTDGATGVVVSLVGDGGERAMMTERGVNAELTFAHVAGMFDSSLVHLHISGYTALDERTR